MEKKEFLYLVKIKGDLVYFCNQVPLTHKAKYFQFSDETEVEVRVSENYLEDDIKKHYFRIHDGIKEDQNLTKSPQITVERFEILF